MNDLPKELWTFFGAVGGVILTFVGLVFKNRKDNVDIAAALREELRKENILLKGIIEKINLDRDKWSEDRKRWDADRERWDADRDRWETDRKQWEVDRRILKRGLDKRDAKITGMEKMERRLTTLEELSEPMEDLP